MGGRGGGLRGLGLGGRFFTGPLGWRGAVVLYGRWADVGRRIEDGMGWVGIGEGLDCGSNF